MEPGFDLIGTWNCIEGKIDGKTIFDWIEEEQIEYCNKTSPPTEIKVTHSEKHTYIKWSFINETKLNEQIKYSQIRQTIDENCNILTPATLVKEESNEATYLFDGSSLKYKVDGFDHFWNFEKTATDQFKISADNVYLVFKKQQ